MILEFDRELSLAAATARFTRWGADPVNTVDGDEFLRVVRTATGPEAYRARQITGRRIEVDGPPEAEPDLRWRLADALPWEPVAKLGEHDERVRELLRGREGYRPPMEPDPYEALVQAITAQQVNLGWAVTTRRRLVETFSEPVMAFGRRLWPFPRAEALASAAVGELRALQFTWRKAEFIVGVAQAAESGTLLGLAELTNEQVIERLVAIRGIGRWSAEWTLARCLARPDAVAAGDLGVRKAISHDWLDRSDLLPEAEVRSVTEEWGEAANWVTHLLLERRSGS